MFSASSDRAGIRAPERVRGPAHGVVLAAGTPSCHTIAVVRQFGSGRPLVTVAAPPLPRFPGGMAAAPEVTPGGCANPACSCLVDAGHRYCCRACARAGDEADACRCQHFGCTARAF